MGNHKSGDKKNTFFGSISVSIAMTTIAVIVMILLLALTINRARENDMVEQYSRQQMIVAKGWAAGIEDLIIGVERNVILFSKLSQSKILNSQESTAHLKNIYDDMGSRIHFIAALDKEGAILAGYPSWLLKEIMSKNFPGSNFIEEVRKNNGPYLSKLIFLGDESNHEQRKRYKTIFIGVPLLDKDNEFSGVIVAALSLSAIMERYMNPPRETMLTDYWIIDDNGFILTNANESLIGKNISLLEGNNPPLLRTNLLNAKEGYGSYQLKIDASIKDKYIVSYTPMNVGGKTWSIVVVTPYKNVVSLLRKTFISIIFGAAGLIIAVIVAVFSVAYIGRRHLTFEEEMKRLKEREDWQEKLLREKKTIDGIIEGSPIPTFVIDREHKVILWNKACAELTGFNADQMIGTDKHYLPFYSQKRPVIADLIINRDFEGLENYYGTKKVEKSTTVEGAYEARDYFTNLGGKSRHLFFLAAPIYDDKGDIIASIETLQDVTIELEMSNSLQEYAETLQNELAENINLRKEVESIYNYLQSLIDSLPDRFYEFGIDGIINYMSRDLNRQRGLTSPQIKGRHFTEFVATEHTDLVLKKWEEATHGVYEPFELETTDRKGAKRNLLINIRPVQDTDRYVIVQRDITDIKNLERKFYESQKLAAVGQLSAGIAHELRNALSSIKMSLQILEKRMTPTGNDLKRFQIASREVEHLEALVNDVLIYAKPAEPKKKPSDIRKIIEHSLLMAEKNILDKQMHVETNIAPNIPEINCDEEMLAQALLNLYRNAAEASETNGHMKVSARLTEGDSQMLRIEIEDDGSGIEEEDISNLFNPFFTKKNYGTGLGLSQVKKIIELHHGSIELRNKEGKGARASVLLPLDVKS